MQDIVKREQALRRIQTTRTLSQIQALEPTALERVVDLALMYESHENHWQAYEDLKQQASKFVGWDASKLELQTPAHYLTMLDFIDWLLPETQEERALLELDEPLYDDDDREEQALAPRRVSRVRSGFQLLGRIIESDTLGQIKPPDEEE